MIEQGDIYLADVGDEIRRRVLVLSDPRFTRESRRVIVAPEFVGPVQDTLAPWRVEVDGAVFGLDRIRSLPSSRLLERTDRAPLTAMVRAQRALRHIL